MRYGPLGFGLIVNECFVKVPHEKCHQFKSLKLKKIVATWLNRKISQDL